MRGSVSWHGGAGNGPTRPRTAMRVGLRGPSMAPARSGPCGRKMPAGTPFEPQDEPALLKNLRAAIVGFEMPRLSLHSIAVELLDEGVANLSGIFRGDRHYR